MASFGLNAGQKYTIKITAVTNTSKYPDGTPAPYTMSVSLDLLSGGTPILATQKQTYAFGPGETRSIDKGNPFALDIIAPSGYPSATLVAKLLDANNNVLAQAQAAVNIISANGSLNLSSSPSGAAVYINGISQGVTTPVSLNLAPDTYSLSLVLAGYNAVNVQVTLGYQEQKTLSYTLTPLTTGVAFSSTPSGASLYLNGVYQGKTPIGVNLGIGIYTMLLQLTGYYDYTEQFTITGAYSSMPIDRPLQMIPPPIPTISFDAISVERYYQYGLWAKITCTLANHTDQPIVDRLVNFHSKYISPWTGVWVTIDSDFRYTRLNQEIYPQVPAPGLISLAPGESRTIAYIPQPQLPNDVVNYMYLEDAATGVQSVVVTL